MVYIQLKHTVDLQHRVMMTNNFAVSVCVRVNLCCARVYVRAEYCTKYHNNLFTILWFCQEQVKWVIVQNRRRRIFLLLTWVNVIYQVKGEKQGLHMLSSVCIKLYDLENLKSKNYEILNTAENNELTSKRLCNSMNSKTVVST